jgi:hypothetical protein
MDKERLERFSDGEFEQFTIEELLANSTKEEAKTAEPENKTEEPAKKPPIIIEF